MKTKTSTLKKIKSIITYGAEPYLEGKRNFNSNNSEIEELARKRAEICKKCTFYSDEPIYFFSIEDRIEDLSKKMCRDCGCSLSYKARQFMVVCEKWKI